MDALIRKACELGEKTAHFRVEVILKATLWMEEKYRQVPNGKIAAMIALHYLMLAMRPEYQTEPQIVEEHIAQAIGWLKAASGEPCDPDGVLKAVDIHDNSIGRSAEEILRKLQAASFVRQHQDEVCPASWRPGKKTLKPGLEWWERSDSFFLGEGTPRIAVDLIKKASRLGSRRERRITQQTPVCRKEKVPCGNA